MTTTITIDWLSFTLKEPNHAEAYFARNVCTDKLVTTTPRNGYTHGLTSPEGFSIYTNPERSDMGTHYDYPGSTLRALNDAGVTPFDILREAITHHAKVTRLDLAKDFTEYPVDFEGVYKLIKAGQKTGSARDIRRIESGTDGVTVYVGSWKSEKFVRLYNKQAEASLVNAYARMELVMRGDNAKTIARILVADNANPSSIFNGIVTKMCNIDHPDWKAFTTGDSPIGLPKIEKQTDRETWVKKQVTGAVLDLLAEHPESEAVYDLYRALDNVYRPPDFIPLPY